MNIILIVPFTTLQRMRLVPAIAVGSELNKNPSLHRGIALAIARTGIFKPLIENLKLCDSIHPQ